MQDRNLSEQEFLRQTALKYLMGGYGLTRRQAEMAAAEEWQIRQEVNSMTHFRSVPRKTSSSTSGFGKARIYLKGTHRLAPPEYEVVSFPISKEARERLQHQAVLSVDDVNELMCGDKKFLNEYARIAGFPPFEPRIRGFRTWKVYEFLRPFKRTVKINMRSR